MPSPTWDVTRWVVWGSAALPDSLWGCLGFCSIAWQLVRWGCPTTGNCCGHWHCGWNVHLPKYTVFYMGFQVAKVYPCMALLGKSHWMRISARHSEMKAGWGMPLCPLHISRTDAPIGLRCSRRQIGTKPSDIASGPHSHWPNGAQCVHSRWLVRGEGVLFITTPSERQLHCARSAPDRPTTSRWSPDEASTADAGSRTHSHWPNRQHRGTIGASDRLMWSGH